MSFTTLLLLGVAAVSAPVTVTIDSCVGVNASEVRRLTATELLNEETTLAGFEVLVACRGTSYILRLLHVGRGVVDSSELATGDVVAEDARNRELAIAVAELLRRAPELLPPDRIVDVASNRPTELLPRESTAPTPPPPPPIVQTEPAAPVGPWRGELGVVGTFVHWTGGEQLLGSDLVARVALVPRLWVELRTGGRRTLQPTVMNGTSIDATGFGAAVGFGYTVTPGLELVDIRLGAKVGADWLRFFIADDSAVVYGGADATNVYALGALTALMALSDAWHLNIELAAGGALRPIAIRDGKDVSGPRGVMAAGVLGMVGRFR